MISTIIHAVRTIERGRSEKKGNSINAIYIATLLTQMLLGISLKIIIITHATSFSSYSFKSKHYATLMCQVRTTNERRWVLRMQRTVSLGPINGANIM